MLTIVYKNSSMIDALLNTPSDSHLTMNNTNNQIGVLIHEGVRKLMT